MLRVAPETVRHWIDKEMIPYIQIKGTERMPYRIPLHGLLGVLGGNEYIAAGLNELDNTVREQSQAALEKAVGGD